MIFNLILELLIISSRYLRTSCCFKKYYTRILVLSNLRSECRYQNSALQFNLFANTVIYNEESINAYNSTHAQTKVPSLLFVKGLFKKV